MKELADESRISRNRSIASSLNLQPIVEVLLKENGIDLNPRDESGNTPLSWAIDLGYFETVKSLVEHDDIDINAGSTHFPPLYLAVKCNHLETVKLLDEKDGIDLNAKGDEAWNGSWTPLKAAYEYGHFEVVMLTHPKRWHQLERLVQSTSINLRSRVHFGVRGCTSPQYMV